MMMKMPSLPKKDVHLYVEKYNRSTQEMLLDFIVEKEFIDFRNHVDYPESKRNHETTILTKQDYEPTMLFIRGCSPKRKIWRGSMITLDMEQLLKLHFQTESASYNLNQKPSAVIFCEILNGDEFAALIDASGSQPVFGSALSEKYSMPLESRSEHSPQTLDELKESFQIQIWNVGQGNTNCILDEENLTIFDFGASFCYSRQEIDTILSEHNHILSSFKKISLMISHWDIDHYNLLCHASDEFLKCIEYAFCHPAPIGLTAKQAAKRIRNCPHFTVIVPQPSKIKKCGIQKIYEGNRYTLFTGEKSRNKNKSGLLLSVSNHTSAAFLTADHSNYQVWDRMYSIVNPKGTLHLVVPHHGGDCGNSPVQSGHPSGIAAVSVGKNNYRHPRLKTIVSYQNKHYEVKQTDMENQDIIIPI